MARQEFEFRPGQMKFISPDGQTTQILKLNNNGKITVPLSYHEKVSTTNTSTTSASWVVVDAMTVTPGAGIWMVTYSSSGRGSLADKNMEIAIYKNNVIIPNTLRQMGKNSGAANKNTVRNLHTQAILTTTGAEAIDIRYQISGGTFTMFDRSLILLKVG